MSLQTLSQKTLAKAEQLVRENKVSRLDDTTFHVAGSAADSQYEVTITDNGYFCAKADGKNTICTGWKFHHNCKHCEAVKKFIVEENK